ncbi:MAG: J domain-containing protein [Pleurocapsa sp.]
MSQKQAAHKSTATTISTDSRLANTYYGILGLHPSASMIAIRRSYRQLSKKYHPDTTELNPNVAKAKFQRLNEAYAVLSNPTKRSLYDLKIGYSRVNVIQAPNWEQSDKQQWSTTAYLDPTDRPLSDGEIFVLLLLGATFIGCLILIIAIAYWR